MLRVGLILNILTLIWQLDIFTLIIGLPWCWERLRAGGEGDDRGWAGWMASPTQWTWIWVDSGSWWWTGRPGVLWFMGSQRVGHDWVTELNWTDSSVGKESTCNAGDPWIDSWVRNIPWRRDSLCTVVFRASLVAQLVKNPPAMCETWVRSLG